MILTIRQATSGDWMLCSALPGNITIARLKRNMKIEAEAIMRAVNAHENLVQAAKCALADLEGIMPEHDPNGDRMHPGWKTINELRSALRKGE